MRTAIRITLRIIGLLLALLVVFALINWPIQSRRTTGAKIEPGNRAVEVAGGELNVRIQGTGPPLVLIHGWMSSLHWWDEVAPELERRYTVIRPDLIGFGSSAKPCPGYGMSQQAGRVVTLMDRLGVRRARVVGHSMGGVIAAAMAERHPDRLVSVAIVDSPSVPINKHLTLTERALQWPVTGQLMETLATKSTMRRSMGWAFAPDTKIPDRLVTDALRPTWCSAVHAVRRVESYVTQRGLERRLAGFDGPKLAVFGSLELKDSVWARESLALLRQVKGMSSSVIDGSAHSPMIDRPDAFLHALKPFLAKK